jgi:hypothetical protein
MRTIGDCLNEISERFYAKVRLHAYYLFLDRERLGAPGDAAGDWFSAERWARETFPWLSGERFFIGLSHRVMVAEGFLAARCPICDVCIGGDGTLPELGDIQCYCCGEMLFLATQRTAPQK